MNRFVWLCLVLGFACEKPHGEDGGVDLDADLDAGVDSGFLLPTVTPAARACAELHLPAAAVCLEGGWFLMSRWTSGVAIDQSGEHRRPLEPVFLDSFGIDPTEVTRGQFAAFVQSNDAGVNAPPINCGGYINVDAEYPEIGWAPVEERSGWTDAGVPTLGSESLPVTCVTRAEAMAFCETAGGRLPTTFEFFRAVRGSYPSQRRFPWGDEPPALTDSTPSSFMNFRNQYGAVSLRYAGEPPPVGTRAYGKSEAGVLDLVGSASEYILECAEDLQDSPRDEGFLIRPVRPPSVTSCQTAILVAGDNWYTVRHVAAMVGVTSLFAMTDLEVAWAGSSCSQLDGLEVCIPGSAADTFGPGGPPPSWTTESKGNQRRSWAVGFRCAYDLFGP